VFPEHSAIHLLKNSDGLYHIQLVLLDITSLSVPWFPRNSLAVYFGLIHDKMMSHSVICGMTFYKFRSELIKQRENM
jgi:hypothetical protein